MTQFNGLTRRFGVLMFGLMLAVGLIAPQAVGAMKPPAGSPNQPGNYPPFDICMYIKCPTLPAISNIIVTPSHTSVAITFDMDMSGNPQWGKARVDILQNGQVIETDTEFAAPSGIRQMVFQFNTVDTMQQYQYKIYREVGQDSYVPHFYQAGNFQTL